MDCRLSDLWQTPQGLFDELNEKYGPFDIDLCATKENTKVINSFGVDYLENEYIHLGSKCYGDVEWLGVKTAFMNPPYSNPKPFIAKAWEDSKHCKIVILVPNTIKTCKYLDNLDKNNGKTTFREWREGVLIRDLSRRTKFVHPVKQESSPSFGCMVIIFDRRGL